MLPTHQRELELVDIILEGHVPFLCLYDRSAGPGYAQPCLPSRSRAPRVSRTGQMARRSALNENGPNKLKIFPSPPLPSGSCAQVPVRRGRDCHLNRKGCRPGVADQGLHHGGALSRRRRPRCRCPPAPGDAGRRRRCLRVPRGHPRCCRRGPEGDRGRGGSTRGGTRVYPRASLLRAPCIVNSGK